MSMRCSRRLYLVVSILFEWVCGILVFMEFQAARGEFFSFLEASWAKTTLGM